MAYKRKTKIKRNVKHRFPGIDRSASKTVYRLESDLALAQRHLKMCRENHKATPLQELYKQLTPRNRRIWVQYGELLLGKPKK